MNYKNLFFILLILVGVATKAQSTAKGESLMNNYKYAEAIVELKPIADKGNISAIRKIAECYMKVNDYVNAEKYYSIVVANKNALSKYLMYYAEMLMYNEKYTEASKQLNLFLEREKNNIKAIEKAKKMLLSCDKSLTKKDTTNRKLAFYNLNAINSPASDFCAISYKDSAILFTSSRSGKINAWDGNSFAQVYFAQKISDTAYNIEPLNGVINTKNYNSGPACIDTNQTKIYYTKNNFQYGDAITNKKGDVTLKIFEANLKENNTKDFKALEFNDIEYSCAYPTISKDGLLMFFTSDRAGGFGGKDIYYSIKKGGVWSKPKNAGPIINTEADERYPFLMEDGSLYFSSNGHAGFGGMDIFVAKRNLLNEYAVVEHLGMPFNSNADDFGYYLDKNYKKGFISSNRSGGLGLDDIYTFEYFDIPTTINIKHENIFLDSITITITDGITKSTINDTINGNGYQILLQPNNTYFISVEKEGFKNNQLTITTTQKLQPISKNIYLTKEEE